MNFDHLFGIINTMRPLYRQAALAFEAMSDGDKSCLFHLVKTDGGQQLTTANSAHNRFYENIERLGWAKAAVVDDSLAKQGSFAAWELTDEGRQELPGFILAVEIRDHRQVYEANWPRELFVLSVKFIAGYSLAQAVAGGTAYTLTRAGVSLEPVQSILSIVLIFGSCLAGILAALTSWNFAHDKSEWIKEVSALDAIRSNKWFVCAAFAVPVFLFHAAIEDLRTIFAAGSLKGLIGTSLTRGAVMATIVAAICATFLPAFVSRKIKTLLE